MELMDGGELNETILTMMETNSRMPDQLRGDLRAQVASCKAGERGFKQLLVKYGPEDLSRLLDALHDYAERLTRHAIQAMPDGEYSYTDYIDGLGESPTPIVFKVKVTISGDTIDIDWAGTNDQVQGAINGPFATTQSVAYAAVRCAIGVDVPNCEGYSRPVSVRAERGSLVNAVEPAACAARGIIAYRMFDTLMGAFAKVVPELIPAPGEGGPSVIAISGRNESGNWLITDSVLGSWGGGARNNGIEGISNPLGNLSNQPIELIEARLPLKVMGYGFVTNSGGAGKQRGGLALQRSYELLDEQAALGLRSDRREFPALGSNGGLNGSKSLNILTRDGETTLLPTMPSEVTAILKGDRFLHVAPGAAGYGDPLLRSATEVLEDVLDDKLSVAFAHDIYGVVISGHPQKVDDASTLRLREKLSSQPLNERAQRQAELFFDSLGFAPLADVL
ncbi:Hydantoinase B/oxoprolinase [compost metagenome]